MNGSSVRGSSGRASVSVPPLFTAAASTACIGIVAAPTHRAARAAVHRNVLDRLIVCLPLFGKALPVQKGRLVNGKAFLAGKLHIGGISDGPWIRCHHTCHHGCRMTARLHL